MNRTRTTLVSAAIAAGLALSGCGANSPTAAPPTAPPSASASTPTATTDTPPATTTTDAPPAATTTTDTPPATNLPTPDPTAVPTPRSTTPAPALPSRVPPAAPVSPTPDTPPLVAPAPMPVPMLPVMHPPAPAPAPAQPAPQRGAAPVVEAPPPATVASSWSGIYDAFTASHPGPSYRVADTGNFGNTNTNGAGTVVLVSIAPRTPVGILQSVLLHEYAHFRQNRAYGPGLGYAVRAVGSPNLDHAADCWALGHGATWVNYGCTNTPAVQGIPARMGD